MGVASSGDVQFCVYNTVIICAHEREDRLDEAAGLVVKTIQNVGFACRTETVNAVEASSGKSAGRWLPERQAGHSAHPEPR